MKILMVCLGNICRSPLAHGLLEQKIEENGLKHWEVDSAGTASYHVGHPPDPRSIEVARHHGIDISQQRARQLKADDLQYYDLIFAMDSSNYQDILQLATTKEERNKVNLLLNEAYPSENRNVPDPYYGGQSGFENVFQQLDLVTDKLLERLLKK